MLPKAHVTLHSRISCSRWVITPSWWSASWKSFLYSSSVYFCYPCLICSASVRSIPFLSFIEPIFAWNVPLVFLIFLKRSLVFPILLFSFISLHWPLWKAFLSLLAILWNPEFKWVYLSFSSLPFAGDLGSILRSGRSPGEENGNPLQYSCLENPRDRGAWWTVVYGVTQNWTWLKRLSSSSQVFLDFLLLHSSPL